MSVGGMTLEQFKSAVQPSFDKRAAIADTRVLLRTLIRERNAGDRRSWRLNRRVVLSLLGRPADLKHPKAWVRKEAKTALSAIEAALH